MPPGRRLLRFVVAALSIAGADTASARAYAPRLDGAAIPSSPSADVVTSAEALGELRFTLDPRIGFFAAGDPVNQMDPDGRFGVNTVAGAWDILNPVPAQFRGPSPGPGTTAGYYGRKLGEGIGLAVSVAELYFGPQIAVGGAGLDVAGFAFEGATLGVGTPLFLGAEVAGTGGIVVGAGMTVHGALGANNFLNLKTEKPSWQQYEERHGGQQTPMEVNVNGQTVKIRLDKPPESSQIIDFKDYNWEKTSYQKDFIQKQVAKKLALPEK